ncbi:unnamed protein product [Cylicocyclus nassatus]|uniref:Uncharacterized protein n=1 Tax=Cylicocyclus nassatus TaxID=53992 RepID=A0AA36GNC0_CYLNA|nr:unnamed protein product [Cylicocyclus nassatus]
MSEKIQFWKDGALLLEEDALQKLLKIAYDKCFDWTEFVCTTSGIRKHEKIDDFGFETTYDAALKKMKTVLQNEERDRRIIQDGPVAFAAPPYASLLEKDGPGIGILTKTGKSPVQEGFYEVVETRKAARQRIRESVQLYKVWTHRERLSI